jgi:hypothetical protein
MMDFPSSSILCHKLRGLRFALIRLRRTERGDRASLALLGRPGIV